MERKGNNDILKRYLQLLSEKESEGTEAKEEERAGLTSREIKDEKERLQNRMLESILKDKEQDRSQRKDYASMIFGFMCWYMFAVFFIIIMNGITVNHFHVSDEVILALLGTTAVEVIGIFAFVAKYLFGNRP